MKFEQVFNMIKRLSAEGGEKNIETLMEAVSSRPGEGITISLRHLLAEADDGTTYANIVQGILVGALICEHADNYNVQVLLRDLAKMPRGAGTSEAAKAGEACADKMTAETH